MTKLGFKDFIFYGLVLFLIFASYIRIYYGVDIQDESFYITLPYRFLLGDIPIVNESSICQFAGIILFPFYKLFYNVQHNSQGIVLYSRHLFFIFYSLLGYLAFSIFRKELSKNEALLFACLCLLYVPYNILTLSYNTLSMLFFTAGSFFAFADYQEKFVGNRNLILSGLFYSLAVFSYPPLILAVAVCTIMIAFQNNYKRALLNLFLGSLPVLIMSLLFALKFKTNLLNIYYWLKATGHTDNKSLSITTLMDFVKIFWFFKLVAFFSLGLIIFNLVQYKKNWFSNSVIRKTMMVWGYSSLLLLPLSTLILYFVFYIKTQNHFLLFLAPINLSLFAPLYFLLTNKPHFSKKLFFYIWIPSLIAGIITATVSGTGFLNSMVGLFPAFIVSVLVIYLALMKFFHDDISNSEFKPYLKILSSVFLLTLLSFLIYYKFAIVIRDNSIKFLESQITSGPYKFIHTSYTRNMYLERINEDLAFTINIYHPKNIFVYPRNFGTYLITNLKPSTNSIWIEQGHDNSVTLNYFQKVQQPEIAVYFKGLTNESEDPLFHYISSKDYLELISRKQYSIYVLNKLIQ